MNKLLQVKDLSIGFRQRDQWSEVVHGVGFEIGSGERVALVGESGSGKSVTGLALGRLLPSPPICQVHGSIVLEGRNVMKLEGKLLRQHRGRGIAYVFQEPSTSLHPQYTVGEQLKEAIQLHQPDHRHHKDAMLEALEEVGIHDPENRCRDYPHELSGGMQQRVMIAMALACRPKLLVADEPTTALDVTIQAQILDLIKNLQTRHDMAVLLITHNFGIVDGFADRLLVMYRGEIVEQGKTGEVLQHAKHEYTRALIRCIPRLGVKRHRLMTNPTFNT